MAAVVFLVDLPNFYSRLLKSGLADMATLKDYFINWLDWDLLAQSLVPTPAEVLVFYTDPPLGPPHERLTHEALHAYLRRITILNKATTRAVTPSAQEPAKNLLQAELALEKELEAALGVHLMNSIETWEQVYLVSGHADLTLAAAFLRQRNKPATGVGFADAAASLVKECASYIRVDLAFLEQDFLFYALFKPNGLLVNWLTAAQPDPNDPTKRDVFIALRKERAGTGFLGMPQASTPTYQLRADFTGITPTPALVPDFLQQRYMRQFEHQVDTNSGRLKFVRLSKLNQLCLERALKKFQLFMPTLPGVGFSKHDECEATWQIA